MRILIISDIHANLTALETVLKRSGKLGKDYDHIWCLGDVVGYGPDPDACVDLIRSLPNLCLAGNHDWAALGRLDIRTFNADARKAVIWTRDNLSQENLEYLEALPSTFVLDNFTLVHASPREPIWEYVLDPLIAALNYSHFETDYCLVGHTHTPIIFRNSHVNDAIQILKPQYGKPFKLEGGKFIINPGSVGQPRDSDPRAAYALLDIEKKTFEHQRVGYDVEAVQKRMKAADLPERLIKRLEHGW